MSSRWRPPDRLALVNALVERPGADSNAFFAAYGLAQAYSSPGRGGGKKAKINAALAEAERRGNLDAVLDAAAEEFQHAPATRTSRETPNEESNLAGKIFISHASRDSELAVALRDALVLGDVPRGLIFYSSERSTGIPSGQNVDQYLRQTLSEASIVIELITRRFLSRPYCLMELGGAWAMDKKTLPIVVPPLTRRETVEAIGNVQLNVLDESDDVDAFMNELYDMVVESTNVRPTASSWGYAVSTFKASFPAIVEKMAAEVAPPPSTDRSTDAAPATAKRSGQAGEEVREGGLRAYNFSDTTGSFSTEIHGEVVNENQRSKIATLKATFFDDTGKIIATASGLVNAVEAGNPKTFTLSSVRPVLDYARYTVQFESVSDSW